MGDRGRVHTVTRTAEVGGYERVWNLSIDQVHTYHVGDTDTLIHNTCDREVADAIAHGHAYAKHVLPGEFDKVGLDLYRKSDFADHIYEVMQRGVARPLPRERTGFLLDETVVVRNPLASDWGSAYPPGAKGWDPEYYFWEVLE